MAANGKHSADDANASDFNVEADEVLRDIESTSKFALRNNIDAEELDPGDVHTDDFSIDGEDFAQGQLDTQETVDELPEEIEMPERAAAVEAVREESEEERYERAMRKRRRLRNVLILFLMVLVLIGATIGVFVWRNSISPDVKTSDFEALQTPAAGTNAAEFQPIDSSVIPNLVSCFGMTADDAQASCGGTLVLTGSVVAETDPEIPAMTSMASASLVDTAGDVIGSVLLGLDQNALIVYEYISFDFDALGVGDAKFEELVKSRVIAESILQGLGVSDSAISNSALTVDEDEDAITSRDTSDKERAEFVGLTNLEQAPTAWRLVETYDHAVGTARGDNSVVRTLSVELY